MRMNLTNKEGIFIYWVMLWEVLRKVFMTIKTIAVVD
jgi:hypothetical protein